MSDNSKKKAKPSRYIKSKPTLALWVASGGRCAQCNKFLLGDQFFELPINLGERAHIAGHDDTEGSPRGKSVVPLGARNNFENLLLLCLECHKIVDDKLARAIFTEDSLLKLKNAHEERILHLTSLAPDKDSAVVRMFGRVRGTVPELARKDALWAVFTQLERYAKFPLSPDKASIEIDLTALEEPSNPESRVYWEACKEIIDRVSGPIADHVRTGGIRHLSIFALARIPLLIYLGYVLDDKTPMQVFQKQRGEGDRWEWLADAVPVQFEVSKIRQGSSREVALIMSVSGPIGIDELPADLADLTVYHLKPKDTPPNPNLFQNKATLHSFRETYQKLLSEIELTRPRIDKIHLFPAIPISAAIVVGKSLMRDVHPCLETYERINGIFAPALTVNSK